MPKMRWPLPFSKGFIHHSDGLYSEEMRREGITQAELARGHGMTRARVNQWLSLLKLPEGEKKRILAMGDHWERRVVTERSLRETDPQSG